MKQTLGKRLSERSKEEKNLRSQLKVLNSIPRLFKMIWAIHPVYTFLCFALRTLQAVLPVAVLYVGKVMVDEVVRLVNLDRELNPDTDFETMILWIGIGLALATVMSINLRLIDMTFNILSDLVNIRIAARLIEHAGSLDLYQFENPEFYDNFERAQQQNYTYLLSLVFQQIQDFITVSALVTALLAFSPWLVLILVVVVVPIYFVESYFNKQKYSLIRGWTPERRELDYLKEIGTSDKTAKEIKIFKLQKFIIERYTFLSEKYYRASKKIAQNRTLIGSLFSVVSTTAYYAVYVFVLYQTVMSIITIGTMTFFGGALQRMESALGALASRLSMISDRARYVQDLFEFFEMSAMVQKSLGTLKMPEKIQTGFEFENVGFVYQGSEKFVLQNLNFKLNAGEKLALVGENGAGKTTIVKLLARLYTPTEGRILLDGIDIFEYDAEEYAERIGVIFQDYVRFMLTAKENIAVGNIVEKENLPLIKRAAEKSLANLVIENLDNQYDQMLGKRFAGGSDLSGGQWQKIALARAYMRDAELIILDEPTAALDARSEHEVFLRFTELTQGKTAVLISHRFSTVRMANKILFLENGRKKEYGTHEELMAQGGKYAELFELQAKGYV